MVKQKNTRKIKKTTMEANGIVDYLKNLVSGIEYDRFTNQSRKTIEKYGDWKIMRLMVFKKPIMKALDMVLNAITLSKWEKAKSEYKIDKLFHVGFIMVLNDSNGNYANIMNEKTSQPDIFKISFNIDNYGEQMVVPLKDRTITFSEFVEKTKKEMGKNFFKYDAMRQNNCQNYVKSALKGNDLDSKELEDFFFQDLADLVAEIPSYTPKISKAITSLGAYFNKVIGKGKPIRQRSIGTFDTPERTDFVYKVKKGVGELMWKGLKGLYKTLEFFSGEGGKRRETIKERKQRLAEQRQKLEEEIRNETQARQEVSMNKLADRNRLHNARIGNNSKARKEVLEIMEKAKQVKKDNDIVDEIAKTKDWNKNYHSLNKLAAEIHDNDLRSKAQYMIRDNLKTQFDKERIERHKRDEFINSILIESAFWLLDNSIGRVPIVGDLLVNTGLREMSKAMEGKWNERVYRDLQKDLVQSVRDNVIDKIPMPDILKDLSEYLIDIGVDELKKLGKNETIGVVMKDYEQSHKPPKETKKEDDEPELKAEGKAPKGLTLHCVVVKKPVDEKRLKDLQLEFTGKSKGIIRETKLSQRIRVVPKTKFVPKSFVSKKVKGKNITLVFGKLK